MKYTLSTNSLKNKKAMSKKLITITLLLLTMVHFNGYAQEKYGKTLNLGLGVGGYSGYYSYVGRSLPVFHINYEFDVAKNFTLAPFLSFYSYSNQYYWKGNKNYPDRYYTYKETVIPIGVKGTYYFDELLRANDKWDFYLAGTLGFAIVNSTWDNDYYGDKNYYQRGSSLYLDVHVGAEYHFNNTLGAFLDLSSGVSTIGLAIHLAK
ncbi:MAG: hypothetical protein HYU68_10830 [Bacteroidetes bacterium]|nr:hypothetical protein [Bacteroidota bacterium]